ncbi:MAG TPA: NUDIX domain-containing protein [Solirubrobacteraceae bacterium]|nr:NUDIX domain-containing protein [Solirubrobacteraceae bacterium]
MTSLNPALDGARFCPRCAAPANVVFPRSLTCDACGYRALWSPEPVAAAIPRDDDGRIWLLRRAHHEAAGRWSFPGGFVELGESVEDAARRETREEMEIEIEVGALVGVYSRADERIVLVVFDARALGVPRETDEASEVRAFAPEELPWDELAFWSTTRALRESLDRLTAIGG